MAGSAFFLIDTNVLIRHLRQKAAPTPFERACAAFGYPAVSDIVIFELEVGAHRAGRSLEFDQHFKAVRSFPLSRDILLKAAEIQANLLAQNQVVGLPDTFIAATAIYHDLPLFTLNQAHFRRITGLSLLELP